MIQPGLERIGRLLQNVQFPWKAVHVAGTNGKGSICAYTSNLLTRRNLPNGRFTSPHIVNRWDCININNEPVSETEFLRVENHFKQLSERESIDASEFELLTATAFTLFNEKKVEVGIIEVGMGGKLDATNILNNQVVSVISKIAQDHQGFLGNTLEEIASHKAGILRPNVPFIVNPMNEFRVHEVIEDYANEIGAGPRILVDTEELRTEIFKTKYWKQFCEGLLPFQRDNAVLALLAYFEVLKSLGLNLSTLNTVKMLDKMRNKATLPGRQQTVYVPVVFAKRQGVLIDGAHNPDAAQSLKTYVNRKLRSSQQTKKPGPITWVLAMTEGKDPRQVLENLLRPGDHVVTTAFGPVDGMPWVKSMDPKELLSIAREVCPGITALAVPKRGVYRALCTAKYLSRQSGQSRQSRPEQFVLTGSLYLVGDFFREHQIGQQSFKNGEEFPAIREIDQDESARVIKFLDESTRGAHETNLQMDEADERDFQVDELHSSPAMSIPSSPVQGESEDLRKLRIEIAQLEREMQSFQGANSRSAPNTPPAKEKFFQDFEDFRARVEEDFRSRIDPQEESLSFAEITKQSRERRFRPVGDAPIREARPLKIRKFHSNKSDMSVDRIVQEAEERFNAVKGNTDAISAWDEIVKDAEKQANRMRSQSGRGQRRADSF
ncbi:FolC bifunctional protein [Karstenula rhodostoma CBS 690.94]|uniref:FolC bifunctional protein n=1 Tax=Karstenula rhodostoma CBS 690.94 TaxID=1392251 RepID=A0A9P4PEN4_9PLEO|nr:FolC bifunctional protein [Karstenula rhodostoma CBS 690.94]